MDPNSSSETEVKQSMDLCSTLGKRKAESVPSSDSDDDGGGEKGSTESDQAWGYDSFEESDFDEPEGEPEDEDEFEFRRYVRYYTASRGFKIDKEMIPKNLFQGFRNLNLDSYFMKPNISGRQYMETMAKVAIDKYNKTQANKTLIFDSIVRVVVRYSTGVKAYITFMAKESPQGQLVEYQAKTERKAWQKNIHAISCNPAPKD